MNHPIPQQQASGAELLQLALGRPALALARADSVISASDDPLERSYAHQARGIVLRDQGRSGPAVADLRRALASARDSRADEREADVRATLGTALVMHGRTREGLHQLDLAAQGSRGRTGATVLMRRAHVLSFLGRYEQALADLRSALPVIRRSGDRLWEARTLNNRGLLLLALGDVAQAERDVRRAERIFTDIGQQLEGVHALHNRGVVAYLRGDLPRCFSLYAVAAARFAELGTTSADLVADRCEAYLAAGLTGDALELVTDALAGEALQARHRCELELMRALAALAHGELDTAAAAARRARPLFARQDRALGVLRCELVLARSHDLRGRRTPARLAAARALAARLTEARAEEAPVAWLLAGRIAAALDDDDAHECFRTAARLHRGESPALRATAWLARALDRERSASGRGVLRACGRGLDELEGRLAGVGGTQLRALVTGHGEELAATALRQVAASGDGRDLLRWTERWRAVAMTRAPMRPPRDPELAHQLAALRATTRALREAGDMPAATRTLTQQRVRLEREIVHRSLQLSAAPGTPVRWTTEQLLERLGDTTLVELVGVQDTLHAVVAYRGRVRRLVVGPVDAAVRAAQRARFALRQAARGRPTDLAAVARQLQAACLGEVARHLGENGVVICPPSQLHDTPWTLCPVLVSRAVGASPSAAVWLAADQASATHSATPAFISGPGLPAGEVEVRSLADAHPQATVLRGAQATVERSLAALDGARVVHIAAHGRHRADNPMFSGLDLVDGPLTVHDLESLVEPPFRVVLSACDSGVLAPVGADEVLGMAAALLTLGTAGVVCAIGPVNDAATLAVMRTLHAALADAASPAEALAAARLGARGDVLAEATAASFTALGA